jgi:hypothetical protein
MLKAVTLDFWDTLVVSDGGPEHDRRQIERLFEELAALGEPRGETAIRDALQAAWHWFNGVWRTEHRTPGALEILLFAFATLGVSPPVPVVARRRVL